MKKEFNLPKPENISKSNIEARFVFIADCVFSIHENILKPFSYYSSDPRRVKFNKSIYRTRNVVERSFGLLAHRFRVISNTMLLEPKLKL